MDFNKEQNQEEKKGNDTRITLTPKRDDESSDSDHIRTRNYDVSSDDEADYGKSSRNTGSHTTVTAQLNGRRNVGGGPLEKQNASLFGFTRDAISKFDADAYDRIVSGETYVFGLSKNAFFLLLALAAFILLSVMVGTFYGYKGESASPVPALEGIARQPHQLLEGGSSSILDSDSTGNRNLATHSLISTVSNSGSSLPALPATTAVPTIASSSPITRDQAASAQIATASTSIKDNIIYPESLPRTEIQRREAARKQKEKERRADIEQLMKVRDALRKENDDIRQSIGVLRRAINLRDPQPAIIADKPLPKYAIDGKWVEDSSKVSSSEEKLAEKAATSQQAGSNPPMRPPPAGSSSTSNTGTSDTEVILSQVAYPKDHSDGQVIVAPRAAQAAGSSENDDEEMPGQFGKPEATNNKYKKAILMPGVERALAKGKTNAKQTNKH